MGITIGKDQGAYDEEDVTREVEAPDEPYREEGTEIERGEFMGTLDTSGVAAGAHADLANVATNIETGGAPTGEGLPKEDGPLEGRIVVNQGDQTDEEIADSLAAGVDQDPANPAEGEPGDGLEENEQRQEEAREDAEERQEEANEAMLEQAKQDSAAGFATESQIADENLSTAVPDKTSAEDVVKGTVPEVEEHLKAYPEDADDVLAAEEALAKDEDREVRAGVEAAVEKYRLFDPSQKNVGDTKAHFESADDAEVERVKAIEKDGQNRPGIMNWTRES